MSANLWKTENDLCRCCHAEGSFLSITDPVYNLGSTEIFMDVLKSCLDIELLPVMGIAQAMKICDLCVHRLRDANNFKKQVMSCEERFKEIIKEIAPGLQIKQERAFEHEVKVEYPVQSDGDGDDGFDARFDDSDDDQPIIKIKVEEKNKEKSKSTRVKNTKKAKKTGAGKSPLSAEDAERAAGREAQRKKGRHPTFQLKPTDYEQDGDIYTCKLCEKKYEKYFSLRHHVRTKHYSKPKYVCAYCKKEFMTPAPLTTHKLEEHNVDDRFKCKACNSAFNTNVQLRKHINNFHMLGEKYKCEHCDYESFSFESMYKHKFKHKTVKDYHCRFCKKAFLRKATLDLHERIHTGDRRKVCKVCGQAFVQKASLNYHMIKYHPEVNF